MWLYGENSCRICGKELAKVGCGSLQDYCQDCLDYIDEGLMPAALMMRAINEKFSGVKEDFAPSNLEKQPENSPKASSSAEVDSISTEQKDPRFWRLNWQPRQQ